MYNLLMFNNDRYYLSLNYFQAIIMFKYFFYILVVTGHVYVYYYFLNRKFYSKTNPTREVKMLEKRYKIKDPTIQPNKG